MSAGPTVLIVRFSALGDVILTTPVMRAIRSALPGARITFVTKQPYRELLESQSSIDQVMALKPGESVSNLATRIGSRFDYALDLQDSLRSRLLRRHISADWRRVSKPRLDRFQSIWLGRDLETDHIADRYLATGIGIIGPETDNRPALECAERHIRESSNLVEDRMIALAPGAAHPNKRWGTRNWFELADALTEGGWKPVMIGMEEDAGGFNGIAAAPAWHLSLPGSIALIARSRAVVAHDSGLMHAAGAVRTPVVSLFGPTSPSLGYRPMGTSHAVIERSLPCRPCSRFGTTDCPAGHHQCLEDITPREVHAMLEHII